MPPRVCVEWFANSPWYAGNTVAERKASDGAHGVGNWSFIIGPCEWLIEDNERP